MLGLPHRQRHKRHRPRATVAGEADSLLLDDDLPLSSPTALTACQKSSVRLPAISKLDVDEISTYQGKGSCLKPPPIPPPLPKPHITNNDLDEQQHNTQTQRKKLKFDIPPVSPPCQFLLFPARFALSIFQLSCLYDLWDIKWIGLDCVGKSRWERGVFLWTGSEHWDWDGVVC
jgi:hypothetical protein